MPSIFSHPVVPLALGFGLGSSVIPTPLLIAGIVVSILPDADVLPFPGRVHFSSSFAHRGLTHSLAFAALMALIGALAFWDSSGGFVKPFVFLFVSAASHGILDAFTNGGRGIAFLWPLSAERYFAPVRPIVVSPMGFGFFSMRGVYTLISELFWLWIPGILLAVGLTIVRPGYGGPSHGPPRKPTLTSPR
jgi:inner membrane protein